MRPILFSLGPYAFAASPVFAGLGAILACVYFSRNRDLARVSDEDFWNLMFALAVGTLLGGFILYFLFYGGGVEANLRYLMRRHFPRGGAFFGSFWGAILAAWIYSRRRGLDFPKIADLAGTSAPLALCVTRLGCLLQACCHGKPSSLPFPLSITFMDPRGSISNRLLGVPLHPTQVYEALGAAAIFLVAHYGFLHPSREGKRRPGDAFCAAALLYSLLRFGLDFLRGRDPGTLRLLGLTTAQLTALTSVLLVLALRRRWRTA